MYGYVLNPTSYKESPYDELRSIETVCCTKLGSGKSALRKKDEDLWQVN